MYNMNDVYYIYDEPVEYKGLKIYPIKVYDAMDFYMYVDCLKIDKNSVPDIKVISMSYLDYMISISNNSNFYSQKLYALLKLCLHLKGMKILSLKKAKKRYAKSLPVVMCFDKTITETSKIFPINFQDGKTFETVVEELKTEIRKFNPRDKILGNNPIFIDLGDDFQIEKKKNKSILHIKDGFYDSDDFDNIKQIILEQNAVEQINENIRKEVRDELDKLQSTVRRLSSSIKMCGFEDQLICVSIGTGFSLKKVNNLTIRKFKKYIERIDSKITFEVYKPAILSGNVTSKDKNFPLPWMADLESDNKYSDILVNEDEIKGKIN